MKLFTAQRFLTVYSALVTIVLVTTVLMGARHSASNANFDQITVHRINVVEPDGTVRMVLSDKAEFPGAYFMGKEYPRSDRKATGMLFNDDEGTETGGISPRYTLNNVRRSKSASRRAIFAPMPRYGVMLCRASPSRGTLPVFHGAIRSADLTSNTLIGISRESAYGRQQSQMSKVSSTWSPES